ncbi:membrane-bound lytic murein transglycosylase MltF [Alteromonas sp. 5E99-2]|uniref:membrane-bound lytic murein transglycosylase MltF n=1 Tax=Alteromonas sp. 5E99-2 TaxID=2817683 RepID=UPI001A99D0F5|nr:membrane-bound lytic murein transglycosylase MltF [Alteromonas sp. 5E99-2]MBO1254084.1 membrane-bound lytic murein transglycosylase MltF [Alteromonas sp. 5E99-2]
MKLSHPYKALLCIFFCLIFFGCKEDDRRQDDTSVSMFKNDRIRVGTVYGRQTYYIGPNGPTGFEFELAKGFAQYLDVELEILPFFSFDELATQLNDGKLDIIASGNAYSKEQVNSGLFRFGPQYQTISHELVYLQGQPRPRNVSDLNAPVTVVEGSYKAASLQALSEDNIAPNIDLVNDQDSEELLVALANGQLSYSVANSNELSIVRRRYPEISIGFTLKDALPVAWQLSQEGDDTLQGLLFAYMAEIRANGVMARLEDRYFGHVKDFDFVDTKAFIKAVETTLPQYESMFKENNSDIDWRFLAALSYQESHWDPKATSRTGVRGMMMLTRDTAKDWGVESRLDPKQSISGGARYFSSLSSRIPARIQSPDRIWMALAAYNIGLGHLEDARVMTQRQGGNPDIWIDVKQRLPLLQQKRYYSATRYGYARGNEALSFVENIRRYYDTLVWLDEHPDS